MDPRLDVLRFIELADDPSEVQLRVARLAVAGSSVVTVNFDDLLEQAVSRCGGLPFTRDAHSRRQTPPQPGEVPVLKLHGSRLMHRHAHRRRSRARRSTPRWR